MNTKLILKDTSGRLPTSTYELFINNIKVGFIQIRHQPSRSESLPENLASHIYYEIFPEFRHKGYGYEILKLGLEKAKEIGLTEVILTVSENNTASIKVIEGNEGVFLLKEFIETENINVLKYKISL
jgi:predicted acetyltransferase